MKRFYFPRREIQTLQLENYTLEKQLHNYQQTVSSRTKSFDNNHSASSTPTSMSGASNIASTAANASNNNNNIQYNSAPATPHVVRKYYEQKYGSNSNVANNLNNNNNNNMSTSNMMMLNQQQQQQQNPQQQERPSLFKNGLSKNGVNPLNLLNNQTNNGGISNLTSQLSSGIANLKLTASNKITSKFMSPFT
jgi:hypothetical protein